MAITNMQYPEIMAEFCGFLGGVEKKLGDTQYQTIIGSIRELDLSEVSTVNNRSEADAKVYDLFSLSDKTVVKGYFWYSDVDRGSLGRYENVLNARFYLYNKTTGTKKATNGAYPSGSSNQDVGFCDRDSNFVSGPDFCRCQSMLLQTYKAKLCLVTEYYNGISAAPNGYGIVILYPSLSTVFPATIQSWVNIRRGTVGPSYISDIWGQQSAESVYYPFVGCGDTVLWISDETYFSNWVKDYDPQFDINDISHKGEVGDPVQELDPSEPGGGEGDWDESSDPVDFPSLPTGGVLDSGAVKAYLMERTQVFTMFNKLWDTNIFDPSNFQKLLDNPIDAIVSFHALPVTPLTSADNNVWLGNFDTTATGKSIGAQYLTVDCGTIKLKEYWGSALDYAPYTKVAIFLPFVGIRQLDVDDCMNANIQVKYNIDILTGDCVAGVKCGNGVIYKFSGNLKQQIPVTGRSNDSQMGLVKSALSGVSGLVTGAAIGGAAGLAAAGISAASSVAASKLSTQRSGSMDGSTGLMDDFVPYLIVHRPIQSLAKNYAENKGYTSNISAVLNTLSGYTEVEFIHLTGIDGATDTELQEIEDLLKKGVII